MIDQLFDNLVVIVMVLVVLAQVTRFEPLVRVLIAHVISFHKIDIVFLDLILFGKPKQIADVLLIILGEKIVDQVDFDE